MRGEREGEAAGRGGSDGAAGPGSSSEWGGMSPGMIASLDSVVYYNISGKRGRDVVRFPGGVEVRGQDIGVMEGFKSWPTRGQGLGMLGLGHDGSGPGQRYTGIVGGMAREGVIGARGYSVYFVSLLLMSLFSIRLFSFSSHPFGGRVD